MHLNCWADIDLLTSLYKMLVPAKNYHASLICEVVKIDFEKILQEFSSWSSLCGLNNWFVSVHLKHDWQFSEENPSQRGI